MISDSCHSGGNTRDGRIARGGDNALPLTKELDEDIWSWGVPNGQATFVDKTMSSHVLLAACRQDEKAYEDSSPDKMIRGVFTQGLRKLLHQENDLTQLTYSMLIDRLPPLQHQHPRCNGKNRGRALFGGVVGHPTVFKLSCRNNICRVEAGDIHGVVEGTLFAIHPFGSATPIEIGVLEAASVGPHSSTLRRRSEDKAFDIPPNARASVLNWRQRAETMKVFVESPPDEFQSIDQGFSLVNSSEDADLVIRRTGNDTLQFQRQDLLMSEFTRELNDIRAERSLWDILQGVSHFNHHLSRRNSANPLKQYVKVELHRLRQSNPEMESEEAIFVPDGQISMTLASDPESNTVFISDEARTYYGFTVTNDSGRRLFPYLIYFDPSDYSIEVRCLLMRDYVFY